VSDPVPPRIDGCHDLTPIGEGGFATVYRAHQRHFDRTVAIKVLSIESFDSRDRARFLDECRLAGRVSRHPNIVTVLDAGISLEGQPYLVSEHMSGGSLGDALDRRGRVPVASALATGIKLCGALTAIHAAGIAHADIKPDNVLISEYGEPALCDFGVSSRHDGEPVKEQMVALTLNHAAPERCQGSPPSPASDVYALASTLYTIVTGAAPFADDPDATPRSTISRVLREPVPEPDPDVMPPEVFAVLNTAMAKASGDRYPTAIAFGEALQDVERRLGLPATAMTTTVALDEPNEWDAGDEGGEADEEPAAHGAARVAVVDEADVAPVIMAPVAVGSDPLIAALIDTSAATARSSSGSRSSSTVVARGEDDPDARRRRRAIGSGVAAAAAVILLLVLAAVVWTRTDRGATETAGNGGAVNLDRSGASTTTGVGGAADAGGPTGTDAAGNPTSSTSVDGGTNGGTTTTGAPGQPPQPGQPGGADPQNPGQTVPTVPGQTVVTTTATTAGGAPSSTSSTTTTTKKPNGPTTTTTRPTPAAVTVTPANNALVHISDGGSVVVVFTNSGGTAGQFSITTSSNLTGGRSGVIPAHGEARVTITDNPGGVLNLTGTIDGTFTTGGSYHVNVLVVL
jgi:hypothetical protein